MSADYQFSCASFYRPTFRIILGLIDKLKGNYRFILVSLFGISDVSELKQSINEKLLLSLINNEDPDKLSKPFSIGKKVANGIETLIPEKIKAVLSPIANIPLSDLIISDGKINSKKIIFIFDDLERTSIKYSELLGIINDYCENQHINTILLANEDYLRLKEDKQNAGNSLINYDDLKEKIIQRTIHFCPDYEHVIPAIINEVITNPNPMISEAYHKDYSTLLKSNTSQIINLFKGKNLDGIPINQVIAVNNVLYSHSLSHSDQEQSKKQREHFENLIKNRKHNFRSLKCALQDFERIYTVFRINNVPATYKYFDKWLLDFIARTLTAKENYPPNPDKLYESCGLSNAYYLYYGYVSIQYTFPEIADWITTGEWNERMITASVKRLYSSLIATTPFDKVRTTRIEYLEDAIIKEGFTEVLKSAYSGNLDFEDYYNFFINVSSAHLIGYSLPEINWDRISEGIKYLRDKYIAESVYPTFSKHYDETQISKNLSLEENKVFNTLLDINRTNATTYCINKQKYLAELPLNPVKALYSFRYYLFESFDKEMADVTYTVFANSLNEDKTDIINYFELIWKNTNDNDEINKEMTSKGFIYLKQRLEQEFTPENNGQIAAFWASKFIEKLNSLITLYSNKNEVPETK